MLFLEAGSAMPDSTGRLTQADNDTIKRWWDTHWKAPVTCPVCKTSAWMQGSHVVNIQRNAVDAGTPGAESYPHIIVGCQNCGHAMFFNAVQIGVTPAYTPPAQSGLGNALGLSAFGSLAPANALQPQSPFAEAFKKK
jgi:hypothetical protein